MSLGCQPEPALPVIQCIWEALDVVESGDQAANPFLGRAEQQAWPVSVELDFRPAKVPQMTLSALRTGHPDRLSTDFRRNHLAASLVPSPSGKHKVDKPITLSPSTALLSLAEDVDRYVI